MITMKTGTTKAIVTLHGLVLVLMASQAWATANIDPADKYAISSHTGWQNWAPAHGGVTVVTNGANGYLEGFAWAENVGWVKLGVGSGPYLNTAQDDYGVNLDAAGNLSGYAWSSHVGWINFNPTHSQVTIDTVTGEFGGYAWAENVGWIHFKGSAPAYNVRTSAYDAGGGALMGTLFKFR